MMPIGGSVEVSRGLPYGCEYGVRSFRRAFYAENPFRRVDEMSTQPRSNPDAKRRGQALAGALAGLVVVIVLFAVFFGVKAGSKDKPAAQPAAQPAAAASQPAADPSADPAQADPQASQPAAANVQIPAALSKAPTVKAGKGKVTKIKITPIIQGTGPVVKKGQTLTANYVAATYKDGKVIDSSWKGGQPFSTPIGVGQVIPGWDNSIPGQRIGSRLQIDVPAAQAYGAKQGDLRFIVDLLAAQ
jgi:peptidylprolyl isomerase